jgi:DNA segregation ATPase FtsK/SpoIIIE, S-DNA-T family
LGESFRVPHYAPFIGKNSTVIIRTDDHRASQGVELLQSIAMRIALMLPHQARYTLIDPVGGGAAFPMQRYLPFVREQSDDIRRDLDVVNSEIKRIIATYLDADSDSFEVLPDEIRVNERLEFIFAANFPKKYDRRAIEALQTIGFTGPKAGRYLFIHWNESVDLPRDMSMGDFENAVYVHIGKGFGNPEPTACKLQFKPDNAPAPALQSQLFDKLSRAKPPQRTLDWDKAVGVPQEHWWKDSAQKLIQTPIGGYGASGSLNVWFGENEEGRPCAHGMLGAMTGAGKSNLYHVMIMGLATRYRPDELKLYLIDGKQGVEFQSYRDLPHAEVVSLHSPPELSRSVLAELVEQMEYRYAVFGQENVRVQNLTDYYKKGQPQGKIPRILLLVDEYQELFEGDNDGIASAYLLKLSQQGRAAGIHMLLASQRFGAVGMLHRDGIFGNFHLLMAMQMRHDDIQALSGFGRRGKQFIMTCDLPGKIVVNDQLGDDSSNRPGKVALLKSDHRSQLIQQLDQKASEELSVDDLPARIILDGKEQPNMIENPQLRNLLEHSTWLNAKEWQERARKPIHLGGLNVSDWFSAERPRAVWLGQEFSVRSQAIVILRRRIAENLLMIGGDSAARYGMLAGILVSLAANADPSSNQFVILDRSMTETQWCETLSVVSKDVLEPTGFQVDFTRSNKDASRIVGSLVTEIERRSTLEDDERLQQPSIFVVMTELDVVDEIRRQTDTYGMMIHL